MLNSIKGKKSLPKKATVGALPRPWVQELVLRVFTSLATDVQNRKTTNKTDPLGCKKGKKGGPFLFCFVCFFLNKTNVFTLFLRASLSEKVCYLQNICVLEMEYDKNWLKWNGI